MHSAEDLTNWQQGASNARDAEMQEQLLAHHHKLIKALEFYADESLYQTPLYDKNDVNNVGMWYPDKGHKARRTLAEIAKERAEYET